MNTNAANVYTDLSGFAHMRAGARSGTDESKRAVAEQIEALFIGMMLKSMRAGNDVLGGSNASMPRDLYDSQIAQQLSKGGQLGFADMMLRELTPPSGTPDPADAEADAGTEFAMPQRNMLLARALWNPSQRKPVASQVEATVELKSDVKPTAKDSVQPSHWSSPEAFVQDLMPAAQRAARQLGTKPEAVLAVAALETGWGRHMPARADGTPSYNLFGIKAHGWKSDIARASTLEFESGQFKRKVEAFRSYDSVQDAIADFATFVKTQPRYAQALEQASDPESFLRGLHEAGYATDPRYGDKLVSLLNAAPLKTLGLARVAGAKNS